MKNNKKGFTLIEIIVAIILISIIGVSSVIGVKNIVKNNQEKQYIKFNNNIRNALEVYLTNHQEIEQNLVVNAKAAVVTLDALKSEGLIDDNLVNPKTNVKMNYKKDSYILLQGGTGMPNPLDPYDCSNTEIEVTVFETWDLSNAPTGEVMYFCPSKNYDQEIENLKNSVDSISSELNNLKDEINNINHGSGENVKEKLKVNTLFDDLTYTAKGLNPNNYVYFEVNSKPSELSYFPNTANKGLWRIVSINSNNEIELLYSEPVKSNNYSNYSTDSSTWCDAGTAVNANCTFYKLKHTPNQLSTSKYYNYRDDDGWHSEEILESETVNGSKKYYLYNSIKNKNWLITKKYYPYYNVNNSSGEISFDSSRNLETKIGSLNYTQLNNSINISESWLYNYQTIMGYSYTSKSFDDYYFNIYNYNGVMGRERNLVYANRCTNSQCTKDKDSSSHIYIYTEDYYPIITLNSKVDLLEPECNENVIKGSKDCPYRLSCEDC